MGPSATSSRFWQRELETISRQELTAHQLRRLGSTVERAASAPFYFKRFKEASVTAETMSSLDEVRRKILRELTNELLVTPAVELLEQGKLAPVEGKARRVLDQREI